VKAIVGSSKSGFVRVYAEILSGVPTGTRSNSSKMS
jgi:hypothetical protein